METIGIVLGLVVLVATVVRAPIHLKLRLTAAPPQRIELVPIQDAKAARFAGPLGHELRQLGFEELGLFRVLPIRRVVLMAYYHSLEHVVAIVYSHPIGVFFDVASINTNDVGLTVSTAPAGGNLDQPPHRRKIYDTQLSLPQAYERLLAERPPGPYKAVDTASFPQLMADEYAREMDWRMQRGGVTESEVRREAAAMNITSDATIEKATRVLQEQWAAESRRHSG